MEISASLVKELRDKTNAGMMDCKKALAEVDGDMDKAVKILREKGIASAAKKAGRSAAEGLLGVKVDGSQGVLLELNCETDFVAATDKYKSLLARLTEHAAKQKLSGDPAAKAAALLKTTLDGKSVEDVVKEGIAALGENMHLPRVASLEAAANQALGVYVHSDQKLATLVLIEAGKTESVSNEAVRELAKEIAMQAAGHLPPAEVISRDQLSEAIVSREKEIAMNQARAMGKPEAMLAKIAEGKVNKVLQEITLLDQNYVKDPNVKISDLVKKAAAKVGDTLTVKEFIRLKVGEKAEGE